MKFQFRIKTILVLSTLLMSCEKITDSSPFLACEKGIKNHPNSVRYQKMADALRANGVVGASLTIISSEGTWSSGIGMADIKFKIPMTPCHTLRVGSVSKIFAATAILKLQEQGKLNIEDKANKFLPIEFTQNIANADKATIKQLLNHTSGIVEYLDIGSIFNILNLSTKQQSAEQNLRSIFGKKADFEVGIKDQYSNSNYLLLAIIIKSVTGKSAHEYITTELLKPNAINEVFATTNLPSSMSRGYFDIYDNGKMVDRTEIDNNAVGGDDMLDGGLIANSFDLALFHEKLITGKILNEASIKSMINFTPLTQELGNFDFIKGYGLGMMKIETNFGTGIGHYGNVQSFNGMVFYFPERKVTIALIRNSDSSKIKKFIESKDFFDNLFKD